jgi:hypothetical protein
MELQGVENGDLYEVGSSEFGKGFLSTVFRLLTAVHFLNKSILILFSIFHFRDHCPQISTAVHYCFFSGIDHLEIPRGMRR